MRSKAVAALGMMLLLGGLAGCGSSGNANASNGGNRTSAKSQKRLTIGFSIYSGANSYSMAEVKGAEAVARQLNATVTVMDPNWDARVQSNQIEDAATSGRVNGLVVMANNGAAIIPAVRQAISAGVKVGAAFTAIGPNNSTLAPQVPGLTTTVGPPLPEVGRELAATTIKACGDKNPCKVLFMGGVLTLSSDHAELAGFESAVSKASNISLTTRSAGDYLASDGRKAMADFLQSTRHIDVVTTLGDQLATGAEQALEGAGIKGVKIIGNGGSELGVKAVGEGRWYATGAMYPQTEGGLATKYVIEAIRGQSVPKEVNVFSIAPINGAVTRANAKNFKPQWVQ